MNILLDLFLTFAQIGVFTFGGGYAMISMISCWMNLPIIWTSTTRPT